MKASTNKFLIYLLLIGAVFFTNCENSENETLELTLEEKVELLENGEWLLKGFEDSVMHTFSNGAQFTHYGTDNVFGEAIPGSKTYTIEGDFLKIDYNFGNQSTFELKFSCDNTIVEFYKEEKLNMTFYKRDSNYKDCL